MGGAKPTQQRGSGKQRRFTRRTRERIRAVDVLFEADQRKLMRPSALQELADQRLVVSTRQTGLSVAAHHIVSGVAAHLSHIDYAISSYAERWRIDRMPATDRAILRVATWELLYDEGAQAGAVILEAVRIAEVLSTDNSPKYINGLLDTIASVAPGLRAQEQAFNADEDAMVAAALAHDEAGDELPDFHDGDDADFAAYGWGEDAGDFTAGNWTESGGNGEAQTGDFTEAGPHSATDSDEQSDEPTDPTADFTDFAQSLPPEEFRTADQIPPAQLLDGDELAAREDTGDAQDPSSITPGSLEHDSDDRAAPDDTPSDVTTDGTTAVQTALDMPLSLQLAANDPSDPKQESLFSDWDE